MEETINYLNTFLQENDTIVIGLSGGPDSMCLLHILKNLSHKLNIICAHINHNIREESTEEAAYLKKYCLKQRIIFEYTKFSKKSSSTDYSEQELREKRYSFFEEIIKKYKAKYLMTAHHGDDLIETILMRLTRGSNLKGYSGFNIETDKKYYKIIKPLIFTTKAEIEKYIKSYNIPFFTDQTNFKNNYTRNRYRHNVLPFLKKENPNVHLKYLKFSKELINYYSFVDNIVIKEINKSYKNNILNITNFKKLDKLIQTKIIEYILDDHYFDNLYLVNDKHVNMIIDTINNSKPNIILNLPDGLYVKKSYKNLIFTRDNANKSSYNLELKGDLKLPNGHAIEFNSKNINDSNYCLKLDSKEITLPLFVRTRKSGDCMMVKNMSNLKKIKDIFIDSKIPKEERNIYPIVTDANGTILWLPGVKKSKFDKAKNENYDIILWYN